MNSRIRIPEAVVRIAKERRRSREEYWWQTGTMNRVWAVVLSDLDAVLTDTNGKIIRFINVRQINRELIRMSFIHVTSTYV